MKLKKKGKDLLKDAFDENEKSKQIPQNTFSRNEIKNVKKDTSKKPKPRTTSIRVAKDTSDSLNALTSVLSYDRLNDLLDDVVYEKVNKLDSSEKELYKAYLKIVNQKRKNK